VFLFPHLLFGYFIVVQKLEMSRRHPQFWSLSASDQERIKNTKRIFNIFSFISSFHCFSSASISLSFIDALA
jgi:hypothetical protein